MPTGKAIHRSLQHAYLASCQTHGVKANSRLCAVLDRAADELTSLSLRDNYIGSEGGFRCLAEVLPQATCLEELDLCGCFLTTENVRELVEQLLLHPTITTVRLLNNRLYVESGKELLRLARHNHGVTVIEASSAALADGNKIPEKILNGIERELLRNREAKR